MKRAAITGHVLYDLRHTFASRHLELGSPLTYLAALFGQAIADAEYSTRTKA